MGIGSLLTEEQKAELLQLVGQGDWAGRAERTEQEKTGLPEFPEVAWTRLFADYRDVVGPSTEAPDAYHWGVFLTTVGLLLGPNVWINSPHPLRPNFYSVLIGRTGASRKSTALRFGELQLEKMGREIEILPGAVSSEGIYQRLAIREGTRLLVYADEFRGLLDVARRQGTRDLIPKLNSLYNCPLVDGIDRRQQPVRVARPFVSLIAGSPLGWLEDAFERGDVSGGFLNRFLFLVGEEKEPIPFPGPPTESQWNEIVISVNQAIKPWEEKPGPLEWNQKAKQLYEQFYLTWKTRQKTLPENLADLTNRIPDHVLKIGLVYSVLEGKKELTPGAVAIAISVGGYLEAVTQSLFGSVTLTKTGRVEMMIIERLKAKSGRTVLRHLRQSLGSKVDTEAFNKAVQNLERAEIIDILPEKTLAGREKKIVILLEHDD